MSAAFTPGPWQWVGHDEIEQIEHPFTSVAEVVLIPKNADPEHAQRNANARLIAAAPELYELAEQFERVAEYELRKMQRANAEDDEGVRLRQLNLSLIRAALAKARGEQ